MTYTIELNLNTKGYDEYMERRFMKAYKLKRAAINWFNTQEHRRRSSEKYQELSKETKAVNELEEKMKAETDKKVKAEMKAEIKEIQKKLRKEWAELNKSFNLDAGKFIKYTELGLATNMYKDYAAQNLIHATSFQDIGTTVKGAYNTRKKQAESDNELKVPRYVDFTTIEVSMANQNITDKGVWVGKGKKSVFMPYKFTRKDDEIRLTYALERQRLALYKLKRTLIKDGAKRVWKYSVLLVFDGAPYGTPEKLETKGKVHISVDVHGLKMVAQTANVTKEFALDNDFGYSEKLSELDRKIENSRRIHNPQNYNPDGTIKSGKLKWNYTNKYKKLCAEKRHLWHKIKETRKHRFGQIANAILKLGDEFSLEKEDFKSLQKRKDYNPEEMSWFDKRKQAGFDIMFNAPYEFVVILKNKLSFYDKELEEITKGK